MPIVSWTISIFFLFFEINLFWKSIWGSVEIIKFFFSSFSSSSEFEFSSSKKLFFFCFFDFGSELSLSICSQIASIRGLFRVIVISSVNLFRFCKPNRVSGFFSVTLFSICDSCDLNGASILFCLSPCISSSCITKLKANFTSRESSWFCF